MDFGLFMMPLHPPRRSVADAYDRDIGLLVQARPARLSRGLDRGAHHRDVGNHPRARVAHRQSPSANRAHHLRTGITKKRREAPSFTAGMDRCWSQRARCPSDQSNPGASRALNGQGEHGGGGPVLQGGEDVTLLPLHHPVDTAHRIAMLDHMARGRFYSSMPESPTACGGDEWHPC